MRSPKLAKSLNTRELSLENRRRTRSPPLAGVSMLDTVEETLRAKLERLLQEHRDLDGAIWELTSVACYDQPLVTRLKKRKLQLKDEIVRIQRG
jgi:hypothetical protein